MFVSRIKVSNPATRKKIIILEPWAEEFEIQYKQTLEFVASSEIAGDFEIDFEREWNGVEYVIIYAWTGCTIEVLLNGENICKAGYIPVPEFSFSEGRNLSDFVKKIFRGNKQWK